MPRIENVDKLLSPGELYEKIKVSREEFKPEAKLEKQAFHPFVNFCKKVHSTFPSLSRKAAFKPEFQDAIEFLDWPLKPEELNAAVAATMIFAMAAAMTFGVVVYYLLGPMISEFVGSPEITALYVFMPLIAAVLFLTFTVQNFPLQEAKTEQVRALTFVPEIIGYMIISMKLVPNLEKAVEFAAEHGRGKVAEEFKKILWSLQLGVYNTLSEALDILAYHWGKFSSEFKESLMRVRASVLEDTEAKRYQLLDETMEKVLESVKNKMENYARSLSQPAVMMFYMAVLLPLILIIILPVGSAFAQQSLARPEVLILIYNIIIPAIALVFAFSIVRQRPPTYTAPVIPDSHPLLPKKWEVQLKNGKTDLRALIIIVLTIGFFAGFYLHSFGVGIGSACLFKLQGEQLCFLKDQSAADVLLKNGKPANYFSLQGGPGTRMEDLTGRGITGSSAIEIVKDEEFKYFLAPENNISPNTLIYFLMITIVFAVFLYYYYSSIYKRRLQVQAMQLESEFKEALYIIASRMGENKPVETAMKNVQTFLPTYKVSQEVFGKTVHNIEVLGMPLEQAVFDKNFGSLKDNPSAIINSSMRLMIDSVKLGVGVASRTLISLSMQLSNSEKVNRMLKSLVSDITSMMTLMSLFIAPAILGITTALQRVVMVALTSASLKTPSTLGSEASVPGFGAFGNFASTFEITPEALHSLATPTHFFIIVAVYVIQVVIILTYFTTKIEEDNDILTRLNIAKALPIAVIVFLAATIAASAVVGSFKGF